MYIRFLLLGALFLLTSCFSSTSVENNGKDNVDSGQQVIDNNGQANILSETTPESEEVIDLGEVITNTGSIAVSGPLTSETIFEDEELSFVDVYSHEDIETVNLADMFFGAFQDVSSLEEYEDFVYNIGSNDYLLSLIVKKGDSQLWDKLMGNVFDFYYKHESKEFIERMNFSSSDIGEQKQEFLQKTTDIFSQLPLPVVPTSISDDGDDTGEYANLSSMEDNLAYCDQKYDSEERNLENISCKNKSYFYKASSENEYCNNIDDGYFQRICQDFIKSNL